MEALTYTFLEVIHYKEFHFERYDCSRSRIEDQPFKLTADAASMLPVAVCGRRLRFFNTDSDQPESCLTSCQRNWNARKSSSKAKLLVLLCWPKENPAWNQALAESGLHPTLRPTSGCNILNSSPPCSKRDEGEEAEGTLLPGARFTLLRRGI